MIAAQAAFQQDTSDLTDDEIAESKKLSEPEKKVLLQKALNMAASNGDDQRVHRLLDSRSKTREFIDINAPDEDGTSPLIYASCFVSFFFTGDGLDEVRMGADHNRVMSRVSRSY
jgi:ankyrin repeat protein